MQASASLCAEGEPKVTCNYPGGAKRRHTHRTKTSIGCIYKAIIKDCKHTRDIHTHSLAAVGALVSMHLGQEALDNQAQTKKDIQCMPPCRFTQWIPYIFQLAHHATRSQYQRWMGRLKQQTSRRSLAKRIRFGNWYAARQQPATKPRGINMNTIPAQTIAACSSSSQQMIVG